MPDSIQRVSNRPMSILILLLLMSTPFLKGSESIERGSGDISISVKADDRLLGPGDDTDIRIWLYEGEGVSATGIPDTWVNLSFDPDTSSVHSIQTDQDGYCTYTYRAPDEIDHTFDVTLVAWIGEGLEHNPNGSVTLHLTFRYQLEILGPKMVLNGSDPVEFSVHVTVNGTPAQFSTMGASSILLVTIVDHSIVDPINGIGRITYGPPNEIGRARIWVSVQGSGYGAERYEIGEAYFDFMIVEEIGPLNITVETDNMNCRRWGSLNLTVRATRGGYPAAGVRIHWSVSRGWLSEQITYTDLNGMSMVHYTATHTDDSMWNGRVNVTVTADDGVETKNAECWFNVWAHTPNWDIDVSYQAYGLQLLPGEDLSIDLCLNGWQRTIWHFIAGVRVDVVIYDTGENEYARKTILENINIDPLKYYFELEKEQVLLIPDRMPQGEYYWEIVVLSPDGVHTYWRKQPRYEKLLILDEEEEAWTFMVFINGDNNLGMIASNLIDDLERQAPDGEFRIICQLDTPWDTMKRYEITPDREYSRIDSTLIYNHPDGPYDSGSSENVYEFMKWTADYAPAEHYCLVMWDHGGGFAGCSMDDNPHSHCKLKRLGHYLREFSRDRRMLDVLVFDMCLMSSMEVLMNFQDCARYMVASETSVNHVTLEGNVFNQLLDLYPERIPSPVQVAAAFVSGYFESFGNIFPFTVLDLQKAGETLQHFSSIFENITKNWDHLSHSITLARSNMRYFNGPNLDTYWLVDARDLIEELLISLRYFEIFPGAQETKASAQSFLDSFDDMMISRLVVDDYNGVNLFLPPSVNVWDGVGYSYIYDSLPWAHPYGTALKWGYEGAPADDEDPGEEEAEFGYSPHPVLQTIIKENDPEGGNESIDLKILIDQRNNSQRVILVVESIPLGDVRGGSFSGPDFAMIDIIEPGIKDWYEFEISSREDGPHHLVVKVISDDGEVLQRLFLGNITMNGSLENSDPPDVVITHNEGPIYTGEQINIDADLIGVDNSDFKIWWDVDSWNGIAIDEFGESLTTMFYKPGNHTITFFASDGKNLITEDLNITVIEGVNNTPPTIDEVISERGTCSITLRTGEGTSDPDGGPLMFLFDFGDGIDFQWRDEDRSTHTYLRPGEYHCAVWVMDDKGSISDPVFLSVEVDGLMDNSPPVLISTVPGNENDLVEISIEGSHDPEGGEIETMVDWGDGNYTAYLADRTFAHDYEEEGDHIIYIFMRDVDGRTNSTKLFISTEAVSHDNGGGLCSPLFMVLALLLLFIAVSVFMILRRRGHVFEE